MQIKNSFSLSSLNYNINLENKKNSTIENSSTLDKVQKNEVPKDIINNRFSRDSLSIPIENKNERLELLNKIKDFLKESYISKIETPIDYATVNVNNITVLKKEEHQIKIDDIYPSLKEYYDNFSQERKDEERAKAIRFINPNQKFHSEADKEAYIESFSKANIILHFLSESEINQLNLNMPNSTERVVEKGLDVLIKKMIFDSVINDVFFAKKSLEMYNPLSSINKDKKDENIDLLDKINEKVLLISKDSTSIKEKEKLRNEIEELLEDFDSTLIEKENPLSIDDSFNYKLLEDLDNIIDNQKNELSDLINNPLKINSFDEALRYYERIEKLDVNLDTGLASDLLINDEGSLYLKNKENLIYFLKFGENNSNQEDSNLENKEEYSAAKINIDWEFKKLKESLEEELELITNLKYHPRTLNEADEYFKLSNKWVSVISRMSDATVSVNESNVESSKWIIKTEEENKKATNINNEIDLFIENIDKIIDLFNLEKKKRSFDLKNNDNNQKESSTSENRYNYEKEASVFDSFDSIEGRGKYAISQSRSIDSENIYKLIYSIVS